MTAIIETYKYREFFEFDKIEFSTLNDCLIMKLNGDHTFVYLMENIKKISIEV